MALLRMAFGMLALAILLPIANCQSRTSDLCTMTEGEVENLLMPILSLVRGSENSTDDSGEFGNFPLACESNLNPLVLSMTNLVMCGEIIDPDKTQDDKILKHRFSTFTKALERMKNGSDAATQSYFTKFKPEIQQYEEKVMQFKSTPEHEMLRIIFRGDTATAANKTELLENSSEFMRKVINLGYNPINNKFLKYLITYVFEFSSFDLSIRGYKQIFDNMQSNFGKRSPEILLVIYYLQQDMNDDEYPDESLEIKEEYRNVSQHIFQLKENAINDIVSDIDNREYNVLTALGLGLKYQILNSYLPEIIQKYYTPANLTKVSTLLDFFRNLPYLNNDCAAVDSLYSELKKNGQEKTVEAFALWLYTRYGISQTAFGLVDGNNKQKCHIVFNNLADLLETYLDKYLEYIRTKEWHTIRTWHKKFPISFRWLLRDVVNIVYQGEEKNISDVSELIDNLPYLDDNCVTIESVANKIRSYGHQNTFEALSVYARLRETIVLAQDKKVVPLYYNMCRRSVNLTPDWIRSLLYENTSSCTITNRKFGEPLAVPGEINDASEQMEVYTLINKDAAGQKWSVSVDNSGLVSFSSSLGPGWQLATNDDSKSPFVSRANETSNVKREWKVENTDDDFNHIFFISPSTNEKRYLSAKPTVCSENHRCVEYVSTANNIEELQWKITC